MSDKDFDAKRHYYNELILQLLWEYLREVGQELRFNQLMYILNDTEDYFYEEPEDTLLRFRDRLKQIRGDKYSV